MPRRAASRSNSRDAARATLVAAELETAGCATAGAARNNPTTSFFLSILFFLCLRLLNGTAVFHALFLLASLFIHALSWTRPGTLCARTRVFGLSDYRWAGFYLINQDGVLTVSLVLWRIDVETCNAFTPLRVTWVPSYGDTVRQTDGHMLVSSLTSRLGLGPHVCVVGNKSSHSFIKACPPSPALLCHTFALN